MTILITGSTGFIGKNLTEYLLKDGWPVVPTCRDVKKAEKLGIKNAVEMDLNNHDMIRSVMRDIKPKVVIHLGAIPSSNTENSSVDYISTNILSTQILCEEMVGQRMLFASSVVVYGNKLYQDELAALSPTSLYGATKAACESLLSYHRVVSNINYTALRLSAVVGPGLTHGAIKDIKEKVKKNSCVLFGKFPGSAKPYVHVEDVCRAFAYCIPKRGREEVYNVCPADCMSIKDIKDTFDPEGNCIEEWDHTKVWAGDNRIIKCKNDKIKSVIGLVYPTSRSAVQTLVGEQ